MSKLRVLVACEESQVVCTAFRNRGHEAYSCDVIDCSGGHPEWHIKDDVLKHLDDGWDMMIAHPPCTHLAVSGARHFKNKQDGRQQEAIQFFIELTKAPIEKTCIENPVCIMSTIWHKPTQIIQPYMFGDECQKTTCLWLKNLPRLRYRQEPQMMLGEIKPPQSNIVSKGEVITFSSGRRMTKWYRDNWDNPKVKSKTFQGIAEAMAEQWG